VIPPEANAEFVCNMEDVLNVYTQPYDPRRPVVCMDESARQLVSETREPIPMGPGRPERYDSEYRRNGVCDLFMFYEPLSGQRHVELRERRTRVDWAHCMRILADDIYPEAEVICVVMDNLNTHTRSAFYHAFEPHEARRLVERFEFHYTPIHGSWLNMAEIELSVLSRQCLRRRIGDIERMRREVRAWERDRNNRVARVDWRYTTEDARIRLKRLYPIIHV